MQNVPENHMDIEAGPQVCVTNSDAVAAADSMEATPFWSGMEISIR